MSSNVKWSETTLLREHRKGKEEIQIRGGPKEKRNTIYLIHMLSKSEIALCKHAAL